MYTLIVNYHSSSICNFTWMNEWMYFHSLMYYTYYTYLKRFYSSLKTKTCFPKIDHLSLRQSHVCRHYLQDCRNYVLKTKNVYIPHCVWMKDKLNSLGKKVMAGSFHLSCKYRWLLWRLVILRVSRARNENEMINNEQRWFNI